MGSSYKNNNINIHRGKPFALMLLLAFGAGIFGVMILHKLREKRVFSLLVKQKDHELLTLHLLFQREQEFNKDARKKIEEMKTTLYSLRSQKLELDRRLSEMESTIASLRDERKVIESTLEEKKNEIKMLTEEGMNSTIPRASGLQSMIKMNETEIKQLKLRLNQTETNSISVNCSTENATNGSQHYGNIQENGVNLTNETKKSTHNKPQMRREAAFYKCVGDQGRNTENGVALISTDENQEKETVGLHNVRVGNVTETVNGTSRELTSFPTDGLKMEKSHVDVSGLGIRVRRRHYKVKKLRDVRNRQSESASSNQEENLESNKSQNEVGSREVHPTLTEKQNETRKTGRNGRGSREIKPKGIEYAENKVISVNKEGNINGNGKANVSSENERNVNARKQLDAKINSGHDIDANRKLLKMHNIIINKGVDEEENETEIEESEGDEFDETREAYDIDRADINKFAELDMDD